jgi:hypothetical protein
MAKTFAKTAKWLGSTLETIVEANQVRGLPLFRPHWLCGSTRRSAPP